MGHNEVVSRIIKKLEWNNKQKIAAKEIVLKIALLLTFSKHLIFMFHIAVIVHQYVNNIITGFPHYLRRLFS